MYVVTGVIDKQTLLFKETIAGRDSASLGLRRLLRFLCFASIGTIAMFWLSWPMRSPLAVFDICNDVLCVSSELPKSLWLFVATLLSVLPAIEFSFLCWIALAERNSTETDLEFATIGNVLGISKQFRARNMSQSKKKFWSKLASRCIIRLWNFYNYYIIVTQYVMVNNHKGYN